MYSYSFILFKIGNLLQELLAGEEEDPDEAARKRLCPPVPGDWATTPRASPTEVAAALKELLYHLLKQLEKRDINQVYNNTFRGLSL